MIGQSIVCAEGQAVPETGAVYIWRKLGFQGLKIAQTRLAAGADGRKTEIMRLWVRLDAFWGRIIGNFDKRAGWGRICGMGAENLGSWR